MFKTINVAGQISAQGEVVRTLPDGRITISTGLQQLTGWPVTMLPAANPTPPYVRADLPRARSRRTRAKPHYPRKSAGNKASGMF